MPSRFAWIVLQNGQLPLQPDGSVREGLEHRCTTTLIWPAGQALQADNTLMVDPCFTEAGYDLAERALGERDASLDDVGTIFVTHLHTDHMLRLPEGVPAPRFRPFRPVARPRVFDAIEAQPCPGHHPSQEALHFEDEAGRRVWVAGDAVLSLDWLREWAYFWPNGYGPLQIVKTWRSVARVITQADVIVPGHDHPLPVTAELVSDLLKSFPRADYASRCPDVTAALRDRLTELERRAALGDNHSGPQDAGMPPTE